MNSKSKTLIGLIIFAVFLVGATIAYSALSGANQPAKANQSKSSDATQDDKSIAAPDFTVYDGQGNPVKLSDFIGKPVVLNFWASWCPPCKSEMPHFNKTYAEVKDDVVFMMVDLVDGRQETLAKGKKYIADQGYTFPVYYDTKQSAADAYGITSIPTTLFIDAKGNIVTGYQGAIDEKTLIAGIKALSKN